MSHRGEALAKKEEETQKQPESLNSMKFSSGVNKIQPSIE